MKIETGEMDTNFKKLSDVIDFINVLRVEMVQGNPLFPTLQDSSLPLQQRISFAPYMLFFSCGCPDVMTLIMRRDKPTHELSDIEKKINTFVNEDNFHYNFFLRDIEKLGYTLDQFSTTSGVVRHVFARESIPVRKLIYSLVHCIKKSSDPIMILIITEILEAGLLNLFTLIYSKLVKIEGGLDFLEYYGDTHVNLELNHQVTSWFSKDQSILDSVSSIPINPGISLEIKDIVIELMGRFDEMYKCFNTIIKAYPTISPGKYQIEGTPPIDHITENWQ